MEHTMQIRLVDGVTITLGDKLPSGVDVDGFSTVETDDNNNVALVELPIHNVEAIILDSKECESVIEVANELKLRNTETMICCGEGEDMGWVNINTVDINTCPFNCPNKEMCEEMCYTSLVFREADTIGYDLAQPMYSHGLECIVVALPGFAYQQTN